MTEQPSGSSPDAAAKAVSQQAQAQKLPAVEQPDDPAARALALRAEADKLDASVPAPPGTVRIKVEPPHSEFHFGAAHIGTEFSPVPEGMVPAVMQSAIEAGVTLTPEG